jgi:hypothetical protein
MLFFLFLFPFLTYFLFSSTCFNSAMNAISICNSPYQKICKLKTKNSMPLA